MSSSTSRPPAAAAAGSTPGQPDRTYFEAQRSALVEEIGVSLEHVLQNINKLNRSLEGVIAVGNEFGSVEALWSTFENVMGKDLSAEGDNEGQREEENGDGQGDASSEGVSEQ